MKNVFDASASLSASKITNELIQSSPFADIVFKGVYKLLISSNTVNILNKRSPPKQ
jgi:hypothetical protein